MLLDVATIIKMVKWTSKRGKEIQEEVKTSILSGDWGDIFAPDFDPEEFDYSEIRSSNEKWSKDTTQKQFRTNVKNMVMKLVENHAAATEEEADLLGRHPGVTIDEAEEVLISEKEKKDDVKHVDFPHVILKYGDILTSDKYCTIIFQIPQGAFYSGIDGSAVYIEVVADPTLYDAELLVATNSAFNSLQWGSFIEAYASQGRLYFNDPSDYAYPDRIRLRCELDTGMDIEQNFVSRGGIPATNEFYSAGGNRYIMVTVVNNKENNHRLNAMSVNVMASPVQQHIQTPTAYYQYAAGQAVTPQQNNHHHQHFQQQHFQQQVNAVQFPPQTPTQVHVQHQTQQQQTPPPKTTPTKTVFQQPVQHMYQSPAATVQSPLMTHALQHQVPPSHQFNTPPVPAVYGGNPFRVEQWKQSQQQQQQQQFPFGAATTLKQPPHSSGGHLPTPGVSEAAGRQQSMSSEYTEETVDTNVVMTSVTKNHRDPTTGSTLEPVVETVQEEPTRVPATTKILNTVTSLLGGGSSSDGSQVSAHMLPSPRKYYAKMGNTAPTVSSNSSGSL